MTTPETYRADVAEYKQMVRAALGVFDPDKCQGVIAPEGTGLVFQCNMPPAVRTPSGLFCKHHQPKGIDHDAV